MPFNLGAMLAGGRVFPLNISVNQLAYNVENEIIGTYGTSTAAGDLIVVTVETNILIRGLNGKVAFDASTVASGAKLLVNMKSGSRIRGLGGKGGDGAETFGISVSWPGGDGQNGFDAFELGCPTTVQGMGGTTPIIEKGYGGGGGGGSSVLGGNFYNGDGGGGGAAYGARGEAPASGGFVGTPGNVATETSGGAGGNSGSGVHGVGGDGGDSGSAAQDGNKAVNPTAAKGDEGSAGSDGNAVTTNGHSWSASGVTVTGAVV